MVGIRNRKKEETRQAILQIAKDLFIHKGYDATTTDEIAIKANIGAGTIFNYFESKADILIEAFAEDFVDELEEQEEIFNETDLHKAAKDLVFQFIYNRIKRYNIISKKLLRQMLRVSITAFKSKPKMLKKMIDLDFMFVDDLIQYLNQLKEKRILSEDFDSNQAAEIIYSAMAFEFLIYLYQEEHTQEDLLNGVRSKLEFILK